MWPALEDHHYVLEFEFNRQEDSLKVLETVTLADFKAHFEKVFFYSEGGQAPDRPGCQILPLPSYGTSEKQKKKKEKDIQAYAEG